MTDYRLYFLDNHNHIRRRVDLDCRDDDHAIEIVSQHPVTVTMELWQRERLVKRFEAQS